MEDGLVADYGTFDQTDVEERSDRVREESGGKIDECRVQHQGEEDHRQCYSSYDCSHVTRSYR